MRAATPPSFGRRALFHGLGSAALGVVLVGGACKASAPADPRPPDASAVDARRLTGFFCELPGSYVTTASGVTVVPGASTPDLSWMQLPAGFCVHFYGNVLNARQVRFAPGGELFVASPTTSTTGGGAGGRAAIVVLPDDDHDGFADDVLSFMKGLPSTQGLLFHDDGHFYFQDGTAIRRVLYQPGDRTPSAAVETVANITVYNSSLHWPKALDAADDGTIYVGNGGDQTETCDPAHPFHGGILALDGTSGGAQIAKGLRNPIALRCAPGTNTCFGLELSRDFSGPEGGREKLFPIHAGDDWGFPCCASQDLPYADLTPVPDCSTVAAEDQGFIIGHTPFGLDFEHGTWPGVWKSRVFVTNHGAAGSWSGARLEAIATDPATGLPMSGSELDGGPGDAALDFATGWDDGQHAHGRPAAVTFAPDGRLFLANDNNGDIVWIAPVSASTPDK